jgi:SNF family Na+-dependent transporter
LFVLVRVLTLGTPDPAHPERNVVAGLAQMWDIRGGLPGLLRSLSNAEMWLAAAGQIFFSLSVGFGVVINYASYLKKRDDIALGSTTAVAGNEFCEVSLGGLITIPAAFLFLGAAGAVGGTFGLGFQTLPLVFDRMPAGQLFGFLWFFLLFIAAITSSLSMLQPAIAFFEEGLGLDRRGSVSLLGFITLMGTGIVVWFTKDLAALDAMDFWVGSFCIFVLATVQTLLYGWVLGPKRGREELERGALLPIPRIFDFVIRYVSPVFLLTIFILWLHQSWASNWQAIQTQPSVRIALVFVLAVTVLFLLLIARAVRTWNARERRSG